MPKNDKLQKEANSKLSGEADKIQIRLDSIESTVNELTFELGGLLHDILTEKISSVKERILAKLDNREGTA